MWYVWSINQQCIKFIRDYVARFFGDDVELFYPTKIGTSFRKGKKVKTRSLLYGGYIFLKYDSSSSIATRIKSIKGVKYYVGECSDEYVLGLMDREQLNTDEREVVVGDTVEVMCGPLHGQRGVVKEISGNYATIAASFFNRKIDCSVDINDLEIVSSSK